MTISQALLSVNTYPIPDLLIQRIGIERGLTVTDDYSLEVSKSDSFRLAMADVYMYLYTSPDFSEQQVSFTQADRDNFYSLAQAIYAELNDPKFVGLKYGFVGESFNA